MNLNSKTLIDKIPLEIAIVVGILIVSIFVSVIGYVVGYNDGEENILNDCELFPDSVIVLVNGKLPFSPEVEAIKFNPCYRYAKIKEEISLEQSAMNPTKVYATYRVLLRK